MPLDAYDEDWNAVTPSPVKKAKLEVLKQELTATPQQNEDWSSDDDDKDQDS